MIEIEEVYGMHKKEIPKMGETIEDDMNISYLIPLIIEFNIYYRSKEICPYNRGNWILDFKIREENKNIGLLCVKLPREMEEKEVREWCAPLLDGLDKFRKQKMN